MKSNKMGVHVKGSKNGFLNTIFGIITKIEQAQLKLHKEVNVTENVYSDKSAEKNLLEVEVKKSQAIVSIRSLQNC